VLDNIPDRLVLILAVAMKNFLDEENDLFNVFLSKYET
jgi:hypothetical protein